MTANFISLTPEILVVICDYVSLVVARGEKLALIDSGPAELMPEAVRPALAQLGCALEDVDLLLNTHGHWDHIQGNPDVVAASGAAVWFPAADVDKLTVMPERFLFAGEEVDLGAGLAFQVIATPGHSLGSVSFYHPGEKILLAADATQGYGGGIPLIFHSPAEYRASLKTIEQLDVETLVLGHPFLWSGQPQFVLQGRENVRRFLSNCHVAAEKVAVAIGQAVSACPERRYDCLVAATLKALREDPDYPAEPVPGMMTWGHGTILSSLRELGVEPYALRR